MSEKRDTYVPVAEQVYFDPDNCDDINQENVQGAIEDLCGASAVSASPGFTWGKSGNVANNTWLLNESVPSNKAGRTVILNSPIITKIFSASEDADTYDLEVYEHEGDETNLTLLTTLSVVASRTGDSGTVSVAVTSGRQLAVKLVNGSGKNVVVGTILKGTI
jgi:hypothetical protein